MLFKLINVQQTKNLQNYIDNLCENQNLNKTKALLVNQKSLQNQFD